jgi:hypothetical protein
MPFEFDPTADFATIVDRTEDVVLTRSESLATVAIGGALRIEVTEQEAGTSGGKYTRNDVRWSLAAQQLPEPPRLGDTMTDGDSVVWTILEVELTRSASRYECVTRRVSIIEGLNQQIDIQQATWASGDAGASYAIWATIETNVLARIQPRQSDIVIEHHHRIVRTTYSVFVEQAFDWDSNHRIIDPAGKAYDVVRQEEAKRIDLLDEILVVESPWPLAASWKRGLTVSRPRTLL